LPKLNARPYFAHWTTPLDPAGRWLCLDRTKRSGLYDRVYFDTTGTGRLDDKSPVGTSHSDQYSASFEPVRVVFKGEDGPITYHLILRFMQYGDNDANLMSSSGGYYAGKVDIGGKKRHVELIDENVNGTFNDRAANMSDCDCVTVEGDKVGQHYLGKMLEVDGQFYQIEVARDGAFIKLQKAENVVLGQVRVPETISEFVAFGENGHSFASRQKALSRCRSATTASRLGRLTARTTKGRLGSSVPTILMIPPGSRSRPPKRYR
jgi:hypothetical protein